MKEVNLLAIKKAHFIGVGGIGVSAIARMMLLRGSRVSGSDLSKSMITEELEKVGAKVFIGQSAENIKDDCDLVVYSPAVNENNPELLQAHKLKIPTFSYPEILGLISQKHYTIAVSGTHGKTTTTGMLAKVFIDAKKDPTVVIGSFLKDLPKASSDDARPSKSNFIAGYSGYFIVEACEYKRSFLNLWPTIGVVTNIDSDHLDYYKDLADIQDAFHEFAKRIPAGGFLVCDINNENVAPILKDLKCRVIDYTQLGGEAAKLDLKLPGEHNRKNAAIALAIADILHFDKQEAKKSLESFSGTWRRFEYKGTFMRDTKGKTKNNIIIYDDYAHHPTEIKATLQGAREKFPDKEIVVVFQPHLYSRTKLLLNDFAEALSYADYIILAPIYASREQFDETISSNMLAEKIKELGGNVVALPNLSVISDYVKSKLSSNSVLITMGAGDIYKVGEQLVGAII